MASEQVYREQKFLANFLEVPANEVFLNIELINAEGKVVKKRRQRGHSPTRNLYNLWLAAMGGWDLRDLSEYGASIFNTRTNTGTKGAVANKSFRLFEVSVNDKAGTQGIVVGTNNTAFQWSQYDLVGRVSNGTSTGKVHYHGNRAQYMTGVWNTGGRTLTWSNNRVIGNYSSTPITLKEVGYMALVRFGVTNWKELLFRDVLTSPVTVPANNLVRVGYDIVSPAFPS